MPQPTDYFRPGFRTLTPYLIVEGAEELITFAKEVFGAEEIDRSTGPDGKIMNAALKIGDSMLEVSEARGNWAARPGSIHIYLPDTDAAYQRAIAAGATSLHEPTEQPYGELSGGVSDRAGNHWYIATYTGRVED